MRRLLAFATALLGGCSAAAPVPDSLPFRQTISTQPQPQATPPPNVLYVIGATPHSQKGSIDAFNAQDDAPRPTPLYIIRPDGNSGFGLLAVDNENNLFAEKYYPSGGGKLYMFASGEIKPTATCTLNPYGLGMAVRQGILYLARASTIDEYTEPFPHGSTCPKPIRTLTDVRAKRYGSGLYGLAVDPHGDLFDVWMSQQNHNGYMDEFPAGSTEAHPFANLGAYDVPFYLTSDRNGNLITTLEEYQGSRNATIAVFPHGSNKPKLFYPSAGGYGGVALANKERELFVVSTYSPAQVQVFDYDAGSASLGKKQRRSFPNLRGDSIAAFSR